jgi:catechol 2,3-dioxygenase
MTPLMIARGPAGRLAPIKTESIHPAVRVGHVHLRVADLDRAVAFYRDALGFNLAADGREAGIDAAFLAAGDYHHHIGLNACESAGGAPRPPEHTGLSQVAFRYPDRRELGHAIRRPFDAGHSIDRATDHGAHVSVHLTDPDGNGIELYYDRPPLPPALWFDTDGRPILRAERVDPEDLLQSTKR